MRILVLVSVGVSLLAICIEPSVAGAETPRACDLLSVQMAESLSGGPVGPADNEAREMCAYLAKSDDSPVVLTITDGALSDAESYIRNKGGAGPNDFVESLPGLGEKNLLTVKDLSSNTLMVFYHQKMIMLNFKRRTKPEQIAAIVEAMRQILNRL